MDLIFIIGLIASIAITVGYIPQVIHTIRLKHMKGISMLWLLFIAIGSILYLAYALLLPSIPLAASSLAITLMDSVLIYHKFKYK